MELRREGEVDEEPREQDEEEADEEEAEDLPPPRRPHLEEEPGPKQLRLPFD